MCRVRLVLLPNTKHAYYFSASWFPKNPASEGRLKPASMALDIGVHARLRPLIQRVYGCEVLLVQCEIKDVDIFFHPLRVAGLRDGHQALLDMPAEHHLALRFAVFSRNSREHRRRQQA